MSSSKPDVNEQMSADQDFLVWFLFAFVFVATQVEMWGILNPHQDLCSNGNPSQIYHTTAGRMNDLCGVAEIVIPQTAGRMNDCFSQFRCDKLSETFRQGKDLSKVTFCVVIQSSFNLVNFKCVPRDISRSFKSCFESQRCSLLGVETSPVW